MSALGIKSEYHCMPCGHLRTEMVSQDIQVTWESKGREKDLVEHLLKEAEEETSEWRRKTYNRDGLQKEKIQSPKEM